MKNTLLVATLIFSLTAINVFAASRAQNSPKTPSKMQFGQTPGFDFAQLSSEQLDAYNALSPEGKDGYKKGFEAHLDLIKGRLQRIYGTPRRAKQ